MISTSLSATCRIAALMTCHNRLKTTLKCLDAVSAQKGLTNVQLNIYLVDDGSIDGTSDAIKEKFPEVNIIQGEGNLFWNGGMRLAWKEAMKSTYDYYLWLNDDSTLYPHAFKIMLNTTFHLREIDEWPCVIAGSMQDSVTGKLTYGGKKRRGRWLLLPFNAVTPSEGPQSCDTVNGNCVLVPHSIVDKIGILSEEFTHGIGDYDYALRARKAGFHSWVAPGYVGTCSKNPHERTIYDRVVPYERRIEMMSSPTNLPPAREMMVFIRRHGGILWPFYWLRYQMRGWFPQLWVIARGIKQEK